MKQKCRICRGELFSILSFGAARLLLWTLCVAALMKYLIRG